MLTKEIGIDRIEILENGVIQVRQATRIYEDDKLISRSFTNREVIQPGDDVSKYDERVQSIANLIHTEEVIQAFQTRMNSGAPFTG